MLQCYFADPIYDILGRNIRIETIIRFGHILQSQRCHMSAGQWAFGKSFYVTSCVIYIPPVTACHVCVVGDAYLSL
jgi:hypothetical protein